MSTLLHVLGIFFKPAISIFLSLSLTLDPMCFTVNDSSTTWTLPSHAAKWNRVLPILSVEFALTVGSAGAMPALSAADHVVVMIVRVVSQRRHGPNFRLCGVRSRHKHCLASNSNEDCKLTTHRQRLYGRILTPSAALYSYKQSWLSILVRLC